MMGNPEQIVVRTISQRVAYSAFKNNDRTSCPGKILMVPRLYSGIVCFLVGKKSAKRYTAHRCLKLANNSLPTSIVH